MKKSTVITVIIAVAITVAAVTSGAYVNDKMMEKVASKMDTGMKDEAMDEDATTLKFLSGISYQPGQTAPLEFTVIDKDGKRLKQNDYEIEHEKRMHVIVASHDLSQFQHVHPVFDTGTNSYKLPSFVFPVAGEYRIFTDFVVASHEEDSMSKHSGVPYQDVIVGNPASFHAQPLGKPTTNAIVNGNTINLAVKPSGARTERQLDFKLSKDGKPVTNLEKYLGALGHLVVLRQGDLEYIHTHALTTDIDNQNGTVGFKVDFKEAGTYKAFAQFQQNGKVSTASFVVAIK